MTLFNRFISIGVDKADSQGEKKRIKVLNLITFIALAHAVFFLWFDYYSNDLSNTKLVTLSLEIVFFSLILYFQYIGFLKFSRVLFTITVFGNLLFHCNYAFKGYYGEYQYLVIPLFSLFLFDKKYVHYVLLILSILAFYLPNYYLNIYPDKYFGYLNASFLFVGIFFIVNFFKRNSEHNEKKLAAQLDENLKMQQDLDVKNKELTSLNKFQNHFFVNIAHEMGTPITLLKGHAVQMIKKNSNPEFTQEIQKMNMQVVKMETLLTDILDIAKIEVNNLVLNKEIISANQLAQKSYLEFQPLFAQKGISFEILLNNGDVHVAVDKVYFERVLGNVLGNAYKYTPQEGSVILSVNSENDMVSFSVNDTGIGITETDSEYIFERFYQSDNHINKASGSGIGLAFSKEVIELHEGQIRAQTRESGGLTIQITLPITLSILNQSAEILENEKEPIPLKALFGKRILIVDDNTEMREYLISALSDFHSIQAENGKKALELIETEKLDAIVTDYMMPVMDGETLVRTLKKKGIKTPVIMITARADVKSKLDMLQLGVDDYLTKPFVEEELLLRLKNSIVNHEERTTFNTYQQEEKNINVDRNRTVLQSKKIVIKNIANPYFGVAQLSEELAISERTLYRILKKETGLSPNMFIRELKLMEVRNLVEQNNNLTLQELATSVGLTNGTYLNQLFMERFGKALNN